MKLCFFFVKIRILRRILIRNKKKLFLIKELLFLGRLIGESSGQTKIIFAFVENELKNKKRGKNDFFAFFL